ncbi:MAG: type II secretion system F family protein [Kiritimatiellae bacterium]|nr:type II secretion system F family protein [Kiritimatiellia bacterium]
MVLDLVLVFVALVILAGAAGVAVKGLLDTASREKARGGDDVMALASHVGDSDLPEFIARRLRARRGSKVRAELPDALDMVANSLTAGLTLPQALLRNLDHFPPIVAEEFARVLYDTRLGFSVGGAFDNFARRLPIPDVQMIVIATKIGVAHGGNLADSYRMLSTLLRDNMAFEDELRAMTTEGRMQAIVMSALPMVMVVLLGLVKRDLVAPLFTTGAGWGTLGVLLGMQGLAYLWIRKIVDIKV